MGTGFSYMIGGVSASNLNSFSVLGYGTQTYGDTYFTMSYAPPPWVKDNMLDERTGKKIFEYIAREDQDNAGYRVDPTHVPDFQPRHSVVVKVLRELRGIRLFRGGTNEEWEHVKKLANDWHDLAVKNKMITANMEMARVDKKYLESHYQLITKAWEFRDHGSNYSVTGDIAIDAYQVVKDAIREMSDKRTGLAAIEYEILKSGGMLLGVHAFDMEHNPSVIVYFDHLGKSTMDKLLNGGKKKNNNGSTYSFVGTQANATVFVAPTVFTPIFTSHYNRLVATFT